MLLKVQKISLIRCPRTFTRNRVTGAVLATTVIRLLRWRKDLISFNPGIYDFSNLVLVEGMTPIGD